jgi:osmoprotectant transport system permease protein
VNAALILAQSDFLRDRSSGGDSCVRDNGFCPAWIIDNYDRFVTPFAEHVFLTIVPVTIGFAIALGLGLLAHRKRWLIPPLFGITSTLYTIPSVALFLILLPITGRGNLSGIIALTLYTQVIIFRNVINGLSNVPPDAVDAAQGMGLTSRQTLLRVELPLAMPEILAGVRIAAATTVGLAALVYLAGGGGLGEVIDAQIRFQSVVFVAGGLLVLLAAVLDLAVLLLERRLSPWRRALT